MGKGWKVYSFGGKFFNTFRRNGGFKLQYGHGGSFKSSPSLVKRNLTVLGRITVVKSLLIPKFNHLILSIPNPTKAFLKRLQKLIYEFVWKNKKDKISRDQLSNDYADGGLRLFKVDLFFEALKGTWIRRIAAGNVDEKGILLFS